MLTCVGDFYSVIATIDIDIYWSYEELPHKLAKECTTYNFECSDDDGEEYVDENPGAGDGKDEEHDGRRQRHVLHAPELELVEQHGDASLQGGHDVPEVLQLREQNDVKKLHERKEDQEEHPQKSRQVLKNKATAYKLCTQSHNREIIMPVQMVGEEGGVIIRTRCSAKMTSTRFQYTKANPLIQSVNFCYVPPNNPNARKRGLFLSST